MGEHQRRHRHSINRVLSSNVLAVKTLPPINHIIGTKLEFGFAFFPFSFPPPAWPLPSIDLGNTGFGYDFAIFGDFMRMERLCLIERKADRHRADFFIGCAHGRIL